MASKGSAYRATITRVDRVGRDGKGNFRWRIFYRTALDNEERSACTRGYMVDDVADLAPGTRADLLRDGRGSIIHIEKRSD